MPDARGQEREDEVDAEGVASAQSIDLEMLNLYHAFGSIDHPRRRDLLEVLATDSVWTLKELATRLVAWEQDIEKAAIPSDLCDRMYVSLYHSYIQKFVEIGVIHFDEDTDTIARRIHADQVVTFLEGADASRDNQQEQHAGREYTPNKIR